MGQRKRKKNHRLLRLAAIIGLPLALAYATLTGIEAYIDSNLPRSEIKAGVSETLHAIFPLAHDVGRIRFDLWEGIVIEDIIVSPEKDFNQGRYLIKIPRLTINSTVWDRLFAEEPATNFSLVEPTFGIRTHDGQYTWNLIIDYLRRIHQQTKGLDKKPQANLDPKLKELESARQRMLARLQKLSTGQFSIEGGRILPPNDLQDSYRVGLEGQLNFTQGETGKLQWSIKLEHYAAQKRRWVPAGGNTSSGVALIGSTKKTTGNNSELPLAAKKLAAKGQESPGFRLNQQVTIDSMPVEFLRSAVDVGNSKTLQTKGKWSGRIDLEWTKDAFEVKGRTRVESAQLLTGKTVLLQGLSIPIEFGFVHNLTNDSFSGLYSRSKTQFGSFSFTAPTLILRRDNIREAKGQFTWDVRIPELLQHSAYPLSAKGQWTGQADFHWQMDRQNPWKIDLATNFDLSDFQDDVHNHLLASRAKLHTTYKDDKVDGKLAISNGKGQFQWAVNGSIVPQWMQIIYPYGHRIVVFYQKLDHRLDMTGIDFGQILNRLPFIKTWFKEEVVAGQTTGSVDVMFHQTDPYYRYYLLARQRLQARLTNSRFESQALPPVNLVVQLEEGFLNFNFDSDADSEKYVKGNINIGLTSYKPVLISEVKGENWHWFERLTRTVGEGVTGQSVDFNIWVNAEGDTLAGFYKSMSYNGVLRFKEPGFTDSSYRKALALNKSDLKKYPALLKLQEKESIEFNKMDLRFSFSNGQGKLDGIILERENLRITGNGNFRPNGERNIYLAGYISDLQHPGQFRLVYEVGNDGKIKKCTLQ